MSLITISEEFGSGGYAIAKQVADTLKLELYDDERLKKEALKEGVREEHLRGLEEKALGYFDRLMGYKPLMYLDILQIVVYKVSRKGSGIIVGHGSQILLKDFNCAMHVRIHSPLENRARAMFSERGIPYETAEKIIRKKDDEYKGFFKYAFNRDPNNPALYDLILNTGKISPATAAKYIADLAQSDEIKACSLAALDSMERMSLERKIHAQLVEQGIFAKMITVEIPEPGKAVIYGLAHSDSEKEKIIAIVGGMKEIKLVENHVVVAQGGY